MIPNNKSYIPDNTAGGAHLTRPKMRMTRRARRTRTKPVGSLVTTMERRDMMTMKESSHDLPPPPRALPPTDTRTSVAGLLRG